MGRTLRRFAIVGTAAAIMAVPLASTARAGVVGCSSHLGGRDVPSWLNCTMDTVTTCLFYWDPLAPNPVDETIGLADCTI